MTDLDRHHVERACARKVFFPSPEAARRSRAAHVTPPMDLYKCPVCAGWHFGNRYHPEAQRGADRANK